MSRLVFFGDSITAARDDTAGGWAGRVARDLARDGAAITAVNLGADGATTADVLDAVSAFRPHAAPDDVWVVAAGINDLHPLNRVGRSLDETLTTMAAVYARISDLAAAARVTVVFVELTPVDDDIIDRFTGEPAGRGRSNAAVDAVNVLLARHCRDRGHALLRVCEPLRRAGISGVLADGVHPSPRGYDVMASVASGPLAAALTVPPGSPAKPDPDALRRATFGA